MLQEKSLMLSVTNSNYFKVVKGISFWHIKNRLLYFI